MKQQLSYAFAAILGICLVPTCHAADSPWNGTWKQDFTKSHLTGDTFTITEKPGGMMHLAAGGMIEYDFACDGKPYTTLADRAVMCTGSPASGYDFTTLLAGKQIAKSHRTFSADGKTMTIKGVSTLPDGSTSEYEEVYKRETGTTGMPGKWLNVKTTDQIPMVQIWRVNGDTVHIDMPTGKVTVDGKLDGSETRIAGPQVPKGAAVTLKAVSPKEVHYVQKLDGKVLTEGNYILSSDGKVMTDEDWIPGRESEKSTYVYVKQ